MFKQSKAAQIQGHFLTSTQKRHIRPKHLYQDINAIKSKRKVALMNVAGESDYNLGVFKLNREHRYNLLTDVMISDVQRGFDTMQQDHAMHMIYCGTGEGKHFCNGTDFKSLVNMKREDNYARIQEYMQALYNLQISFAENNKPMITVAPGHILNSGATLLAASGHPMTTPSSKIGFNETTFGFVPHSGGSFYMSRLKGEMGTFMALTGLTINNIDAQRLDMSRGQVNEPKDYAQIVADHVQVLPFPLYGASALYQKDDFTQDKRNYETPWKQYIDEYHKQRYILESREASRYKNQSLGVDGHYHDNKWIDPEDRSPSSIALANERYMRYIKADAADREPAPQSYLDYDMDNTAQSHHYKNYYAEVMNFVTQRIGNPSFQIHGTAVNHQELIDRCFYPNSIEEIMDRLAKESHPFARKCLLAMQRNSPQAMQLALSMLRKAEDKCYKECLKMELNVAFNRIKDEDFDIGVNSILINNAGKSLKDKPIPEWFPAFKTEREIESYFEQNQHAKGINIDVVENALLPTKDWYKTYTDQVRLWINESSTPQPIIRQDFDTEAKYALKEIGIDVRDLAMSPKLGRDHLAGKLKKERVGAIQRERAEQLMCDQQLREEYFGKIQGELDKFRENDNYFYDHVNKYVKESFNDAYFQRLDHIFRKSQNAHSLEKRRLFIRMKKFYFKERIMQSEHQQMEIREKQMDSMPWKQIHQKEKWDESWRENGMMHPEMWRSPIYYISKCIGRVSLTMPELAKMYLTDPEARNQMQLFTINKEELTKLHDDMIANPEKWEMLFIGHEPYDIANVANLGNNPRHLLRNEDERGIARQEDYDYWFRFWYDGQCPHDSLIYNRMATDYKNWVDMMELKAYDTLRAAINQLLIYHDDAVQFNGNLKNLINLANQHEPVKEPREPKDTHTEMGSATRPLEEIQESLNGMLMNDAYFGKLFPKETSKNPHVLNIQNEFKNELLKLVEIVLLDKHGQVVEDANDKKRMERILAQLSDPAQKQAGRLNLIDTYLGRKNGEALVKDAFKMVAPFFVEQMKKKIVEEAEELTQNTCDFETNQSKVLIYYFLNKHHPHWFQNPALHNFKNWSAEERSYKHIQMFFPETSEHNQRKNYMSVIGSGFDFQGKTPEQIKSESKALIKEQVQNLNDYNERMTHRPGFKPVNDIDKVELTEMELMEVEQAVHQLCDIGEWLYEHKYEIDHHLTTMDKCKMLGISAVDYQANLKMMFDSNGPLEDWMDIGVYAKWLADCAEALETHLSQGNSHFDAVKWIEGQDIDSMQAQTFYHAAKVECDKAIKEYDAENSLDRRALIRKGINDFNSLQTALKEDNAKFNQLSMLVEKQTEEVQEGVARLLKTSQSFVDMDLLASKIRKQDFDFIKHPFEVLDVSKAVKMAKKNLIELDSNVDVLSLHQLKMQIKMSDHLDGKDKEALRNIVDYIMDQTKYLSNEERKCLRIKDYLEQHHYSSTQAYKAYSNELLQHKIEMLLGKSAEEEAAMIEWQVGMNRTLPSEHKIHDSVDAVVERSEEYLVPGSARIVKQIPNKEDKFDPEMADDHSVFQDPLRLEKLRMNLKMFVDKHKKNGSSTQEDREQAQKIIQELRDLEAQESSDYDDELSELSETDEEQELLDELDELPEFQEPEEGEEEEEVEELDPEQEMVMSQWNLDQRNNMPTEFKIAQKYFRRLHQGSSGPYKYYETAFKSQKEQDENIIHVNDATGAEEEDTVRDYFNKIVYREARELVELDKAMIPTKNLYEHRFLLQMVEPQFNSNVTNDIIEEYSNMRLQMLMLNPKWNKAMKTDNAHIYLKFLREAIVKEMNLDQPAELQDLEYGNITDPLKMVETYNPENKYNMRDLNNEYAIGFNNLEARAEKTSKQHNYETAHESVFDQLLADYWLTKRGEYKESNKLMKDLTDIFRNDRADRDSKMTAFDHLQQVELEANVNKQGQPHIRSDTFRDLIKLDVTTARALSNDKNGMSTKLAEIGINEKDHPDHWFLTVPKYFEIFDVRKPADKYVQDKLLCVVAECFETRQKLEKSMTRAELMAFDKVLAKYLQKDKLMPRLEAAIEADYNMMHQTRTMVHRGRDGVENEHIQGLKKPHDQRRTNKEMKDEDAPIKMIAMMAMEDRRKTKEYEETGRENKQAEWNEVTFEQYYYNMLKNDAKKAPRPVNPEDFKKRKPWDKPVGTPWKSPFQKYQDLHADQALYNEGKLEQQERTQLFFVLEQFYEAARRDPNEKSQGQKLIKDYFNDPDNTHFFDKNKIV